jgi:hypothetical protein
LLAAPTRGQRSTPEPARTWQVPSPTPCEGLNTADTATMLVVVEACEIEDGKHSYRVVAAGPRDRADTVQ